MYALTVLFLLAASRDAHAGGSSRVKDSTLSGLHCLMCALTVLSVPQLSFLCLNCLICAWTVLVVPAAAGDEHAGSAARVGDSTLSGLHCFMCVVTVLCVPGLSYLCLNCLICTLTVLFVPAASRDAHSGSAARVGDSHRLATRALTFQPCHTVEHDPFIKSRFASCN
jgi:hypothetical protein